MDVGTVALVYNHFRTPGGDAVMFEAEAALLRRNGWRVVTVSDATPDVLRVGERIALGAEAVWSRRWSRRFTALMTRVRPDVVHVHNTFPVMSPSVLYAAKEGGATVVQTLHDFRLVCPSAVCFRDGAPCEDCVGRTVAWPALAHGCYRDSRVQSAAPVAMLAVHRALGTWDTAVDRFLAPSETQRDVLVRGGIPAARIRVVQNFVDPDPAPGLGARPSEGRYCLYAGMLSEHKGIRTMLDAWRGLGDIPLKVLGSVPSSADATVLGSLDVPGVEFLGRRPREEVLRLMRDARLLVFPSRWYEVAPMAILEAFACGVPVVASRVGSLTELVEDGRQGLMFAPGDAEDLAEKVRWAWTHAEETARMGAEARCAYERRFTAEAHYAHLREAYA
jgi:glycosyltransferase involved in cell wall biosynthesis